MPTLLILDANQRSALAVIRSLGQLKAVKIYAADSTTEAIGGSSRFCLKYLTCPSLSDDVQAFMDWLKQTLVEESIDLIFPMTESSSQLLLMHNTASDPIPVPFSDYHTVMSLTHKGQLTKMAESAGVPCPPSVHYNQARDVDYSKVKNYPVVIKPCLSRIRQGNCWIDTVVQIAHNKANLEGFLSTTPWLQSQEFMLQDFIPGYGAGLFALYNHGEPVCFFSHKRLREKPPQGGVSVLSESTPLDPILLDNAKKILSAAKWHGVAMVEFRVATDGTPYLMEVNTRFWGSLQLAIDAGVNFPELLYRITLGDTVPTLSPYKTGVRLRWLLGDLDSLYLVLKNSQYSLGEKLACVGDFFTPHLLSTRHEVNRWNDLKPAFTELKQYFRDLIK
ncbi:ATP-grasp domain-containing protein [Draconibacterium sp.]|nr:ATP-grasp domain-containing protein [Draconibacterium sp.]